MFIFQFIFAVALHCKLVSWTWTRGCFKISLQYDDSGWISVEIIIPGETAWVEDNYQT